MFVCVYDARWYAYVLFNLRVYVYVVPAAFTQPLNLLM